jgi:hypothetical protein
MSKTWKWILGILAVLLIVAVVVAGVFIWRNQVTMMARLRQAPLRQSQSAPNPNGQATPAPNSPNGPTGPFGYNGRRSPMGGWGNRGPMMGGRGPMMGGRGFSLYGGFMPFGMGFFFLGGLLRLIIPLGVLVLVAFIFYAMGKRAGASAAVSTAPPTPAAPSEAPQGGRKVAKS